MTTYNFGDVILVPFPFTDQTTVKKRPGVVISSNDYNLQRIDAIVIAVTSQMNSPQQFGELIINDWVGAKLIKPSMIKPVVTTIEQALIIRKLGSLQKADLQALKGLLRNILDS